jgi:hypothetical protein
MRREAPEMSRLVLGIAIAALLSLAVLPSCGGSSGPWAIDSVLVGAWNQIALTEDGFLAYFTGKVMTFRDDGKWRSDSADGGWSRGGYRTREGRLNYWINASDDPSNVGGNYNFAYEVTGNQMTISGHIWRHYYVATFARV